MPRAKYQVLVIPYCIAENNIKYAVFHRSDMDTWQFIAGGGETEDGSVLSSAKREAFEEASIPTNSEYTKLDTQCSISTEYFSARKIWGETCLVIPEYCFAVKIDDSHIKISHEHTEYRWMNYDEAKNILKYDSNKVALWELDNKIKLHLL
jgi:dATP pyrophosphohydrolase